MIPRAVAPPLGNADDLAQEAALVQRARTDAEAFARLYDRYVERVYRYAFRRLASHADAEDLTALTFRRALEHLDACEWRGAPFGAWLFRIAANLIVDRRRAAGGALSLDHLGEEAVAAAWETVKTLPALQRRAVALRFGRDLSHAEVGAIIGRSEAATKQLIYRAIKTLRTTLEESA